MRIPTPPPFDRRLSLRIDRLIIALEATSDPTRRAWLRFLKFGNEREIPPFVGRAR
jgi:hypothetical protein